MTAIQRYYKLLNLGRKNEIFEISSENFKKLWHIIGVCKYDDSEATDFDGFLKIKYYFIDKQATEEELKGIQDKEPELYEKYFSD